MARQATQAPRDDKAPDGGADASADDKKKGRTVRGMTGKLHTKLHVNSHVVLHNA